MTTSISNNRKMILSGAAVLAFGVAAYGLGRIYPPLGPSEGTVGPAQRYVSAQVGEGDVTLGDTAVPELMQTDAFELMVHDANFRALAASPGFQALASQPQAHRGGDAQPAGLGALAKNRNAFAGVAQAAQSAAALAAAIAPGKRGVDERRRWPCGGNASARQRNRRPLPRSPAIRPASPTSRPTPTPSATLRRRQRPMRAWQAALRRSRSSPATTMQ